MERALEQRQSGSGIGISILTFQIVFIMNKKTGMGKVGIYPMPAMRP